MPARFVKDVRAEASTGEVFAVFVGLCGFVALQVAVTRSASLLTHPMWLDECVTRLLVTDGSFRHMMTAIHGGVETNGPAYYIIAWPIAKLGGVTGTGALRLISATTMVVGLAGVYALCRTVAGPAAAWIGAITVAVHPAIVVQMWQFRMYAAWFASVAWFCLFVTLLAQQPKRSTIAGAALTGVLAATTHWLGAIVVLVVGSVALATNRRKPAALRGLGIALGFIVAALLLCAPMISSQRSILATHTWIETVTLDDAIAALRQVFFRVPIIVPALIALLRLRSLRGQGAPSSSRVHRVAPTIALLAFPVVMVVFSLIVQPTLVERYLIVAVVPIGLLTALIAPGLSTLYDRIVWAGATAAVLALGCLELNGLKAVSRESDDRIARAIATVDRVAGRAGRDVVFARRFEAYPALHARPALAAHIKLLDVAGLDPTLMRRTLFERDLARVVPGYYRQYQLVSAAELRERDSLVVVTNSSEEAELRRLLPGFDLRATSLDEYVAVRRR